jgi:xanthine dehydrogenase YagS FAD-binding subunit
VKPFAYDRATEPEAAVALLAAHPQAQLLGGGTNLIDLMKLGVATPAALVDVSALDRRQVEELDDGGVRIGAAVRNSELAAVPAVRERFPLLSMALLSGASGQLRNMATTGGNLFQRTRCVYFMDATKPCNKRDPGSGCPAIEGDHRNLAILGASEHCVATHPSDMAVALAALDAVIRIQGPDGGRAVPISELHRLPGAAPERDTTLAREEIVTAIEIPALPPTAVSTYRKVRDRASYAFAVASVAAVLVVDDGLVSEVRLALGGVAHKPWRAGVAEARLHGAPATRASFRAAIDEELEAARPLSDNAFKVGLVSNIVTTALAELAGADAALSA